MPKGATYPEHLEQEICKQMTNLVELLTTSGKPALNPDIMKKFKRLCRTSDAYVEYAYELLLSRLMKEHAEIRLSAFQMIDELFNRSHAFRQCLLADFQCFLELTVGTSLDRPLPPPKQAAQTMKTEACKSIHAWHGKFGEAYKQLALGYQFLKNCKKIDFDGIHIRVEEERRQQEETKRKLEESRKLKVDNILTEMKEASDDIDLCIKEVESCLELLIPHPDSFFISESENVANHTVNSHPPANTTATGADKPDTNMIAGASVYLTQKAKEKETTDCSCGNGNESKTSLSENSPGEDSVCKQHGNGAVSETLNDSYKINSKHKRTDIDTRKSTACVSSDSTNISVENTDKANTVDEAREPLSSVSDGTSGCSSGVDHIEAISENLPSCSNDVSTDASKSETVNETDKTNDSESEYETDDSDEDFEDVGDNSWFTKDHGLFNHKFELSIEVGGESSKLLETEDNQDIIREARDQYKLIKTNFLPTTKRWLQTLEKHGGEQGDIKQVEELKARLEDAKKRCIELEVIAGQDSGSQNRDGVDSDDEFEEVRDKEGYEDDVPEHVRLEALRAAAASAKQSKNRGRRRGRSTQRWLTTDDDKDPTSWKANVLKLGEKLGTTSTATSPFPTNKNQQPLSDVEEKPSTSRSLSCVKIDPSDDLFDKNIPGPSHQFSDSVNNKPGTSCRVSDSSNKHRGLTRQCSDSDTSKPVMSRESSDSRKMDLLDKAPVVPFGVDLEHWEDPENLQAPLKATYEDLSRFWVRSEGDSKEAASEEIASLTRRTTTYTGDFEPVKWKCRAPLPNGGLCERMDRKKCPFHGKIIARDLDGQPSDLDTKYQPADGTDIKLEEVPLGEHDPDLQAAIQASMDTDTQYQPSGSEVKVKSESSGSKGKQKGKQKAAKRKHPNLTDITPPTKTSRDRLGSKIFKKSTMSRVNASMDAMDAKKVRDRFANQFNYSLK